VTFQGYVKRGEMAWLVITGLLSENTPGLAKMAEYEIFTRLQGQLLLVWCFLTSLNQSTTQ
jgi:hypothetical protein